MRIQSHETLKWVAIDGKALRGTLDAGDKQNLILAVVHDTREVVAQARQCGDKSSEIPVVSELLKVSGLDRQKVSLVRITLIRLLRLKFIRLAVFI